MCAQSTRLPRRGAPSVPRICEHCSAEFLTWAYKVKNGRARFCKPACFHASQASGKTGPSVPIDCTVCGTSFMTWPYRLRDGIAVCSNECKAKSQQRGETRTCAVCSVEFYFSLSRMRQGQPGRYCSLKCRDTQAPKERRKSSTRNSADYRDWRTAVYQRDDYTCQRCNKRGGHDLHAHHIKGWTRYPSLRFNLANGVTLCHPCHIAWHREHGWR
jgi:5-methylcytosine-specific restriction endonuclease McrA